MLALLANRLCAMDDFIRGFVAASSIVNGQLFDEQMPEAERVRFVLPAPENPPEGYVADRLYEADDDLNRVRYYASTLETGTIGLPRVLPSNVLWHILGLDAPVNALSVMREELRVFSAATTQRRQRMGAVIAAVYSVGVSAVLNYYNITGREMNEWAAQSSLGHATGWLNGMLNAQDDGEPPEIRQLACALARQCTRMFLDESDFQSLSFCGGAGYAADVVDDSHWFAAWGRNVPYMIQPLTIGFLFVDWADLSDVMRFAENGILIGLGDTTYDNRAGTSDAVIYPAYGVNLLTCLMQLYRLDPAEVNLQWMTHISCFGTRRTGLRGRVEDEGLTPVAIAELICYSAGTLKTFDWTTRRTVSPILPRASVTEDQWYALIMHRGLMAGPMGLTNGTTVSQNNPADGGLAFGPARPVKPSKRGAIAAAATDAKN